VPGVAGLPAPAPGVTVLVAASAAPDAVPAAPGVAKALGHHAAARPPIRRSMATQMRPERRSGRWLHESDRKNLLKAKPELL
jgi:hypothetical protein